MEIEYKGYRIMQSSYNHHVMICKDDQMVFHASCTKIMSKKRLREMADLYIDRITPKFDAIYHDESGE